VDERGGVRRLVDNRKQKRVLANRSAGACMRRLAQSRNKMSQAEHTPQINLDNQWFWLDIVFPE
jgi:hypothetical protein